MPCVQPLWRTVWRFLKKLEIELPYDLAIPLLGVHTEETIIGPPALGTGDETCSGRLFWQWTQGLGARWNPCWAGSGVE